ncbi:MAG: site-specific integrase [Actinobacteria bacterium]|nr:site-specific integrase [Actinomycetota bacterium]
MPKRRQFGSVRKLPSGRWQARYNVAGNYSVTAPRTFLTKTAASQWLVSVEADQVRGAWIDPRAGQVPLAEYAWAWLEGHGRIAKRTREIYTAQLRLHVLPEVDSSVRALGEVQLAQLTPDLIRRWHAALGRVRSPSSAAKAYTRLRQILGQAVIDERIARNPCRIERGGVERTAEQRFVSMRQLYEIASAVPGRYRALVLTAGLAGLRLGELSGLRWEDIDLLNATIDVRRQRVRLASGEVLESPPKSDAGSRRVSIPSTLVDELVEHRRLHAPSGEQSDLVFLSPAGTPLERSNFRYRAWAPAVAGLGLNGLRFHDLRHTAGTLAAQTGATTKELMARFGHSSSRASMIYQHAAADRDRRIADGLDEMAAEAGVHRAQPATDRCVPLLSGTEVARREGPSLER